MDRTYKSRSYPSICRRVWNTSNFDLGETEWERSAWDWKLVSRKSSGCLIGWVGWRGVGQPRKQLKGRIRGRKWPCGSALKYLEKTVLAVLTRPLWFPWWNIVLPLWARVPHIIDRSILRSIKSPCSDSVDTPTVSYSEPVSRAASKPPSLVAGCIYYCKLT
jgi:hypothetical protein